MPPSLAHVDCWIFDLDLTLYPPEANIMAQIRNRIGLFVAHHFSVEHDEAHRIRERYYHQYGTTLGGLMAEHGVDPHGYMDFVHDVDMSQVEQCGVLRSAIETLPGRKLVFTNADAPYAQRILSARGLDGLFEDVFDIHRMQHRPKPAPESYVALCSELEIEPERALFIEDSAHNLAPAKSLGMTTIWVNHGTGPLHAVDRPPHVDHETDDLTGWLVGITERETR